MSDFCINNDRPLLGDKVMFAAVGLAAVAAAMIGYLHQEFTLGAVGGLALAALATAVNLIVRGYLGLAPGADLFAGDFDHVAHPAAPWRTGVPLRYLGRADSAAGSPVVTRHRVRRSAARGAPSAA